MPSNWYALWTRSRHEKRVCEQLAEKKVEAFLPTVTKPGRSAGRGNLVEWPLFPGYCFARFEPDASAQVRACRGVAAIVGIGGIPLPVVTEEIDSLRQLTHSRVECSPYTVLEPGMRVEVCRGPLRGIVGRLVRVGPRARLVLSVSLIGQSVIAEVDIADVDATPHAGVDR